MRVAPPLMACSPGGSARELAENVRRDMVYAEAQELGLISDDAHDALQISDDVLCALGVSPDEVGQ